MLQFTGCKALFLASEGSDDLYCTAKDGDQVAIASAFPLLGCPNGVTFIGTDRFF